MHRSGEKERKKNDICQGRAPGAHTCRRQGVLLTLGDPVSALINPMWFRPLRSMEPGIAVPGARVIDEVLIELLRSKVRLPVCRGSRNVADHAAGKLNIKTHAAPATYTMGVNDFSTPCSYANLLFTLLTAFKITIHHVRSVGPTHLWNINIYFSLLIC